MRKLSIWIAAALITVSSCKKDDDSAPAPLEAKTVNEFLGRNIPYRVSPGVFIRVIENGIAVHIAPKPKLSAIDTTKRYIEVIAAVIVQEFDIS